MTHLIQTIHGKQSTLDVTHQTNDTISLHWYESPPHHAQNLHRWGGVAFKLFKKGSRLRMTMWFFVTLPWYACVACWMRGKI